MNGCFIDCARGSALTIFFINVTFGNIVLRISGPYLGHSLYYSFICTRCHIKRQGFDNKMFISKHVYLYKHIKKWRTFALKF